MWWLIGALYVLGSLIYIHRLHLRLRGYEQVWQNIEEVADRNEDGSFTIHVKHVEHVQAHELHSNDDAPSGPQLIELDDPDYQEGFDPRAA